MTSYDTRWSKLVVAPCNGGAEQKWNAPERNQESKLDGLQGAEQLTSVDDTTITLVVTLLCGLIGLLIGSFLNVVIWRVPRGESIVSPPSACPRCGARIRARENVPVISWLVLRGRCRSCRAPISARYPLVELGTGLLFARWAGGPGSRPSCRRSSTSPASRSRSRFIDLDTHRLPDAIVLPAYPVGLVLLALASWANDDWWALARGGIGAVALFAFYFVLMIIKPGGMGFGDVKLAGVLGLYLAWVGWAALVVGAFAAFLVGGIFSIVLLLSGRATRKSGIPFGPFMLLGAWIGIVAGEPLAAAYLSLARLTGPAPRARRPARRIPQVGSPSAR